MERQTEKDRNLARSASGAHFNSGQISQNGAWAQRANLSSLQPKGQFYSLSLSHKEYLASIYFTWKTEQTKNKMFLSAQHFYT